MRSLSYLLALFGSAFVVTPALAEWQSIGKTSEGVEMFVDLTTVKIDGNTRRAWTLTNLPKAERTGERSVLELYQFDCADERVRRLQGATYADTMGKGKSLASSSTPSHDEYVTPKSFVEIVFKQVCSK